MGFNPRVHEERDWWPRRCRGPRRRFNPRVHEERDTIASTRCFSSALFQSTRPRGTRLVAVPSNHPYGGFNPRVHEERDIDDSKSSVDIPLFQSTRSRGTRQ